MTGCDGLHTPAPAGYREWHEWARRIAGTHRQERCPACGLWLVWTPHHTKEATS